MSSSPGTIAKSLTLPEKPADEQPVRASLSSYLLQFDPTACVQVELIDQTVDLPTEQFDALLVDSECEV